MNGKATLILLAALLVVGHHLKAQHTNGWLRGTAGWALGRNRRTEGELQGRWQSRLNNANPVQEKLLFSYRHWLYYNHSESLRFGISPFAYYNLYRIIQDSSDLDRPPTKEYRLTISTELRHRLLGGLFATDKTMLEYRMFDLSADILRLRNKLGLEYVIRNAFKAKLSHEVLLNAAGTSKSHFFDHERTSLSAEYKPTPTLAIEVGYIHARRLPLTAENTVAENNLFINLVFTVNAKTDKQ